jgi:hypothetical protein
MLYNIQNVNLTQNEEFIMQNNEYWITFYTLHFQSVFLIQHLNLFN